MTWLYIAMAAENDEKLEQYCPSCRSEILSDTKCARCGKSKPKQGDHFTNPNFNADRFAKMKAEAIREERTVTVNKSFNMDRFNRLKEDSDTGIEEVGVGDLSGQQNPSRDNGPK